MRRRMTSPRRSVPFVHTGISSILGSFTATTQTITSQVLGKIGASRQIWIVTTHISTGSSANITDLSVNGVSATKVFGATAIAGGIVYFISFWRIADTTNFAADIELTYQSGTKIGTLLSVYRTTGFSVSVDDTDSISSSSATTLTRPLSVSANGSFILAGVFTLNNPSPSIDWDDAISPQEYEFDTGTVDLNTDELAGVASAKDVDAGSYSPRASWASSAQAAFFAAISVGPE